MVIKVDNKRFRFFRVYNNDGQKVNTMCFVKFDEYPNIGWAFAGMAKLHPNDRTQFDKGVGKFVALRHALENLGVETDEWLMAERTLFDKLPKALPNPLPTGI